jgi:hypothetical protein
LSDHCDAEEPFVDWVNLDGGFYLSDLQFILSSTNWRPSAFGTGTEEDEDEGPMTKPGQKMRKRRRVDIDEEAGELYCKDIDRGGDGASEGGASGGAELV